MTLLKQTVDQTDTLAWSGDSVISEKLENVGIITELRFTAEITPSATLTGANQPDALNRLVQNLEVVGSSQDYFTLPGEDGCHGGTMLHELNKIDGFGVGHPSGSVTAPVAQAHIPMTWVLHPGSRPEDRFDLSAAIPAGMEGQLRIKWTTSGNDVMDDTVTIASAVGRVEINRITADSPGEILAEMQRQAVPNAQMNKLMTPLWSALIEEHSGQTTDFSGATDSLPAGTYIKRIAVLTQDATADRPVRSADQITRIQLRDTRRRVPVFQYRTQALTNALGPADQVEADDAAIDFQGHAPQGIFVLDLRQYGNKLYGMNLMNGIGNGDFELGYIIASQAAGDDRLVLFERVLPAMVDFNEVRK